MASIAKPLASPETEAGKMGSVESTENCATSTHEASTEKYLTTL
jgi:hypothetical protein